MAQVLIITMVIIIIIMRRKTPSDKVKLSLVINQFIYSFIFNLHAFIYGIINYTVNSLDNKTPNDKINE
jgi:hypothetical protein